MPKLFYLFAHSDLQSGIVRDEKILTLRNGVQGLVFWTLNFSVLKFICDLLFAIWKINILKLIVI